MVLGPCCPEDGAFTLVAGACCTPWVGVEL